MLSSIAYNLGLAFWAYHLQKKAKEDWQSENGDAYDAAIAFSQNIPDLLAEVENPAPYYC